MSLADARRIVGEYNENRLHSVIGYLMPLTKLIRKEKEVWDKRDRKLVQVREKRANLKLTTTWGSSHIIAAEPIG